MAGLVQITYEGKQSITDIQKKFKEHLSQKEILKSTAYAINRTADRVQAHIRVQVRKEYTIKNKSLEKMSNVSKMAAGETTRLYAHVSFSYLTIPMILFRYTGTVGEIYNIKTKQLKPITVTIRKGQTKVFRHAFIRQKKNGSGLGIFSYGRYQDKKFVPDLTLKKQTELKSASPFTMAFSKGIQPKINDYVAKELPGRLQALLDRKLKKMSK